ncbi:hypothetical protein BR93DRAFT_933503 [Coniochaeta sp. PMI_546]|nr:hypothetical protein BR93DRAFT_933503 [Coniochaeta sp. PMI_546]
MADKLRLIRSPLVNEEKDSHSDSSSVQQHPHAIVRDLEYDDEPEFQRHAEATNSEVFFDLFFAADLTVFSDAHDLTDLTALSGYIAYFCVLWLTWALIGLYDVRFVTDSIFERITRAAHLGVMVGIAVVAPNFDPTAQVKSTFRVMSVVLLVSRAVLALQYGTIIWHVRKYKNTMLPLGIMVAINITAAIIYLGIVFGFQDYNTYVYVAWYVVSVLEVLATVGLSLQWKVLSFKGTHLINRMAMLTFIMIGEGVIVVATGVGKIVVNADSWTPATIGNVVAGIGNLYIIYMLYFDFMRHINLPSYRQLSWALLHFPFHLAMNIFVQGSSQFVVWWKIMEILRGVDQKILNWLAVGDDPNFNPPSVTVWFANQVNTTAYDIYALYPPKYYDTWVDTNSAVDELLKVPESWWTDNTTMDANDPVYVSLVSNTQTVYDSIENSLFASFKIDGFENVKNKTLDSAAFEDAANSANWSRFYLVFTYAFITAGLTLILMNLLLIASRTKRWTPWNYTRAALNFLFGVGFCLVSLIQFNDQHAWEFQSSPWVLPTLLIAFFTVLVLNHLPHPPPVFFKRVDAAERKPVAGGRTSSWDVVGHLGYRNRRDHDKVDSAVSTSPAQGTGYEARPPSETSVV